MLKKVSTLADARRYIQEEQLVFLYIGQPNCSVCHSLKPQVERLLESYDDVTMLEIDALEVPEVAEAFNVLTVPVLLLFVEGREYLRKARIIHTKEFSAEFAKIVTGYREMVE
ncbi:thioredoxin family protein [Vagococcus sp. BWB3-3]|uniref:Thioredoxin family protein n=1 Tax=Vagococcus allomyrinae TaxID=2794353 RepID=A0A940SYY3_9ENTE|nr:thioredoxin family protein [Vagococcus allomyrinae]MBP1043873.1 thioredoxin family protein [Vagococcus allomyrinae]